MRATPQIAIDILRRDEECVLRVYDDARPKYILQPSDKPLGTLTSGYGHTGFVFIGDLVTQAKADNDLLADIREAAAKLAAVIGSDIIALLTENQYAALLLFVFNAGTGDPNKPEWNIWKLLRAKHFDQVPIELARFVNGRVDGKMVKISGLVKRRSDEIALWSKDEPGSVDIALSSSITRQIETPPTVSDPVPASKSKTIITGVVGAVATVPAAVTQVSAAIAPYADKSHYVANVIAILASIGAAAAVLILIFTWLKKRNARN